MAMHRGGAEKEEEEKNALYTGREEGSYTNKDIDQLCYANHIEMIYESNKVSYLVGFKILS